VDFDFSSSSLREFQTSRPHPGENLRWHFSQVLTYASRLDKLWANQFSPAV
jgi:hypothetical protein